MPPEKVWWYEAMGCADDPSSQCFTEWKAIHIAALVPSTLSAIASIFIIFCSIKYHFKFPNLTFAAKLPAFLSIADLGFELFHGGDHLHNLRTGYVAPSSSAFCQMCGSMKQFWTNAQTAWACGVAIYLYRCVFSSSSNSPTFGPNNVFLHLCCWGVPAAALATGFVLDVYGVEGAWCGIPDHFTDTLMVNAWIWVAFIFLVAIYAMICFKLRATVQNASCGLGKKSYMEQQKKMRKVMRTIGLYPVAYVVQWHAYSLYKMGVLPVSFGIYIYVVLTANSGGIFNVVLYGQMLWNQVKRNKHTAIKDETWNRGRGKKQHGTAHQVQHTHTNTATFDAMVVGIAMTKSGGSRKDLRQSTDFDDYELEALRSNVVPPPKPSQLPKAKQKYKKPPPMQVVMSASPALEPVEPPQAHAQPVPNVTEEEAQEEEYYEEYEEYDYEEEEEHQIDHEHAVLISSSSNPPPQIKPKKAPPPPPPKRGHVAQAVPPPFVPEPQNETQPELDVEPEYDVDYDYETEEDEPLYLSIKDAKAQKASDKEKYLNDDDFQSVFGMSKQAFYKQPGW
eukprot:CAMPEP_0202692912 /NCGR_PEP_ID=MMETSP1385-20130828/7169_1 /ASSEMBLY_ACC=CAM_ASM_000861 /TAXON_ID=933848 /ORGANISM="Elphidium margaritaceum" /LENGTH=561 /DNA_ID=CAMNT_0049348519 /DNA_START=82 /DNA_END=1764 /DNA_ORIENTATION=-